MVWIPQDPLLFTFLDTGLTGDTSEYDQRISPFVRVLSVSVYPDEVLGTPPTFVLIAHGPDDGQLSFEDALGNGVLLGQGYCYRNNFTAPNTPMVGVFTTTQPSYFHSYSSVIRIRTQNRTGSDVRFNGTIMLESWRE